MAALARTFAKVQPICRQVRTFSVVSGKCFAESSTVDKVTHTGQVWDKNDYRRVRFTDKDKLVNDQFAINLIAEDPIVVVNARHVWSDSGGALGHPKVYINLDKPEVGVCGYSGRKFIQKQFYDPAQHGESITYEEYLEQMRPKPRE